MLSFEFYKTDFSGEVLNEKDWGRYSADATAFIEDLCNLTIPEGLEIPPVEPIKRDISICICELAELIQKQDEELKRSTIVSESTDGYSVHYAEYSPARRSNARYEVVSSKLAKYGLLYPSGRRKTLSEFIGDSHAMR